MKKLFIVPVLMLAVISIASAEELVYYCQGDSPECKVPIPLCPEGQECEVVVDVIDTSAPALTPAPAPEPVGEGRYSYLRFGLGLGGGFISAPEQAKNIGLFLAQPTMEFPTTIGRWVLALDLGSVDDSFLLSPGISYIWNAGGKEGGLRLGLGYRYAVAFDDGKVERPLSAHYGRLDVGWEWYHDMFSLFVSGYFGAGEWGEAYSTSYMSNGQRVDVEGIDSREGFSAGVLGTVSIHF